MYVAVAILNWALPASSGFKIEVIAPTTGPFPIELHTKHGFKKIDK